MYDAISLFFFNERKSCFISYQAKGCGASSSRTQTYTQSRNTVHHNVYKVVQESGLKVVFLF